MIYRFARTDESSNPGISSSTYIPSIPSRRHSTSQAISSLSLFVRSSVGAGLPPSSRKQPG